MSQAQSAIIPENSKSGIFIEANYHKDKLEQLKKACAKSLEALASLQNSHPDASLGVSIGFGYDLWQALGHSDEGQELKPFTPLGNGLAPATQCDIAIHIQSIRQDVCFSLALELVQIFGDSIDIQHEIHGFRWVEERGLDGFVDGTENPHGDEKIASIALIPEGQADSGGSYMLLQKYRHDLKKWDKISVTEQEASIGRSKVENIEFSRDQRLPDSHLGRVNIKENGVGLKIVRRSLPYGLASGEHGLIFCAYSARLYNIDQQLKFMFGDIDGKTDLLLTHLSTAETGAYYFVPNTNRLQNL